MGMDSANGAHKLWHEALVRKYDNGETLQGEDFHKMLWRYDVRFKLLNQERKRQSC
jgi:hypothetical protein